MAVQRGVVAGGLGCSHHVVLYVSQSDEWHIEAKDGMPAEALGTFGPLMKSCCSEFEPVILHGAGSIAIVPDVRDVRRARLTLHRSESGLEEQVGRMGYPRR